MVIIFLDQVAVTGNPTSLWVAYMNDQTGCFSERTEMDLFVLQTPTESPIVQDTVVCSGAAFNLEIWCRIGTVVTMSLRFMMKMEMRFRNGIMKFR